jgi:hypothetical protein
MKELKHSIWNGKPAILWAIATICFILAEGLLLYVRIWRSPSNGWTISDLYVPLMISVPYSTGVNLFRKFTKLPAIMNDRAMVDACSLYVASLVLVTNATLFICIADCLLRQYHNLLK